MDFKDSIFQLSERIEKLKENITTEEATKNAFIMPLIAALGYDVFNPLEVVPELDCDLVKKKGEKIDYAIMKDGNPILLIECKHWNQNLNLHDTQLQKYFVASNARFGVLTNGIEYRFYTDLEKPNIMDVKPFLVIDMLDLSESEIEQLKKFHKSYYDENNILSTAQELKYTTELRNSISAEFASPSSDFVRYFARPIYGGQVSQKIIDQFAPLVKKAIAGIINDTISDRLGLAIKTTQEAPAQCESVENDTEVQSLPDGVVYMSEDGNVMTTQEEMDSYHIVKAILREVVDVKRIAHRDTQSYFGILLDDNNRKPICRMYFNAKSVKYIVICEDSNDGVKYPIETLDDIYKYADNIKTAASRHLNKIK
ncbi:MAG: type I restriction endonuclease [Lachnospiraceae bacterium]|nr:type I restriction endonuclease [Bacteroides sp.]MCM1222173.1 type I restriction endonuclease [Lachnospiraceae bacterium]